jgi:hypothetical protein
MAQERQPGQWRDDRELPLDELDRAMAVYSTDGQLDDATGGDAGAEAAFGDQPPAEEVHDLAADPDPDSELGRALRPSPEGRSGPV